MRELRCGTIKWKQDVGVEREMGVEAIRSGGVGKEWG